MSLGKSTPKKVIKKYQLHTLILVHKIKQVSKNICTLFLCTEESKG